MSGHTIAGWLEVIQADYRRIPGLNLTKPQMQRLWGFDPADCEVLIEALLAARVLRRTERGSYVMHQSVT